MWQLRALTCICHKVTDKKNSSNRTPRRSQKSLCTSAAFQGEVKLKLARYALSPSAPSSSTWGAKCKRDGRSVTVGTMIFSSTVCKKKLLHTTRDAAHHMGETIQPIPHGATTVDAKGANIDG